MNETTELVIIVDKSGSMANLKSDVIGGFNSLIEEQKKESEETIVTTIFFSDTMDFVHEGKPISDIKALSARNYMPMGCTALLDAVGDAIAYVKARHARLKEDQLPAHTVFSIITDGLENASREYTYTRVKSMIQMQTKAGWDFIFQAANLDAAKEASRLGIRRDMAFEFKPTGEGIREQMAMTSGIVNNIRRKGK